MGHYIQRVLSFLPDKKMRDNYEISKPGFKPNPVQENLAFLSISLTPKAGQKVVALRKKSQAHQQSVKVSAEGEPNIKPISMGY